jgi:hypothetical protein
MDSMIPQPGCRVRRLVVSDNVQGEILPHSSAGSASCHGLGRAGFDEASSLILGCFDIRKPCSQSLVGFCPRAPESCQTRWEVKSIGYKTCRSSMLMPPSVDGRRRSSMPHFLSPPPLKQYLFARIEQITKALPQYAQSELPQLPSVQGP